MSMTTSEAARFLGITIDAVQRLFQSGKVRAKKVDGKWSVEKAALVARMKRKAR